MKEEQKKTVFSSKLFVSFAFNLAHTEYVKSIQCIGEMDFLSKGFFGISIPPSEVFGQSPSE